MELLPIIQIILSVALIGLVLIQQSEASLGGWAGDFSGSSGFKTKRGIEKTLFIATIIVAILFVVSSIATLVIK